MSFGRHRVLRLTNGLPGLVLAMLALISQLALGSVVLPDSASAQEQSTAALDAFSIICSTPTAATPGRPPAHHRHAPDGTLCPLCVTLAMQAVILATAPVLPAPAGQRVGRAALPPPARAPPSQPRAVPPARGPPARA